MKNLIFFIMASLALFLGIPATVQASPLAYNTERIYGQDQIETAVKISQKGWLSASTVILCEASDFPDCIAATPFAAELNAPILLTGGTAIDQRVRSELTRLNPQKVILLGGTACLRPSIEDELRSLNLTWERIGGYDRYETSILLAQRLTSDSLILANGDDFPDALSAATFAGIKKIPIVLTSKTLPNSIIEYYQEAAPQHLIVVGGEAVISSEDLTKNNFVVETRLAGYDRYETNAKVIAFSQDAYATSDLFIASGLTFPDALTGTSLAAKFKTPLLITEKDDIPPAIYTYMREHMKVEPPTNNSQPLSGIVTALGGLNLRDEPSLDGAILCTVPMSTTIDLSQREGEWYKVTYQSYTGWISANYVAASSSYSTTDVDLRENGQVYILGGTGIISAAAQDIMDGKTSSLYKDNLRDFPPLPSPMSKEEDPPPVDPTPTREEVLVDPFADIPANALAGKFILIDPGHGGRDTGAIGPSGTYEKNNALAMALALDYILKQAGAKTVMTRTTDVALGPTENEDLEARVNIADQANPDLFISIHCNSVRGNTEVQGTETYYYKDKEDAWRSEESKYLAKCIQTEAVNILETTNRGVKDGNLYVLRYNNMPSILFETGFICNPEEEARLSNPIFQQNVAAAIFRGIYNYYENPLSPPPTETAAEEG